MFLQIKNSVATITLNRPDRYNAVNQALIDGIVNGLNRCKEDEAIRSIVLTGNGPGFCAGADMSVFAVQATPEERRDYIIEKYQPIMELFFSIKKPIIGAINGAAYGGGCEIAAALDFVYVSENARFALPELQLGIIPGAGGTQNLSRAVGERKAKNDFMSFTKAVLGEFGS